MSLTTLKVKESLKDMANIKKRQYQHAECSPARMIKNGKAAKTLWIMQSLCSLVSGLLASEELPY